MSDDNNVNIDQELNNRLEINTDDYALGYIKGYAAGFKSGSQVSTPGVTRICFLTKVIVNGHEISAPEYCEIVDSRKDTDG